jgi:hypothetical protein
MAKRSATLPGGTNRPDPPPMGGPGDHPAGTNVPGFQYFYGLALQSILSNPAASLSPEVIEGYTALAVLYATSSLNRLGVHT